MSEMDPGALSKVLLAVGDTIERRKRGEGMTNTDGRSYVRGLLDGAPAKVNAKIIEEAGELCDAIADESEDRVASEAADLLFHVMVGLSSRDLSLADVGDVLQARFGRSGIDEKEARGGKDASNSAPT
jgi:phosphoribosyl-ATP pyrophosphohydrolase/phosphoribosyl-AMP cyclohydrolase